ncbi:MAG: riboflavin synthase [Candidatus Tokpelaia sp.]|nr:MAG: riboflavin synthase [Candidatus Tokpelaia sp.]KAA6207717.1 MAG: riboflavin synthase [Candidatus Tokpelaia sp.]
MFTGLITDIGVVTARSPIAGGLHLRLATHYPAQSLAIGASIACAGICLTVTKCGRAAQKTPQGAENYFEVEAWEETLRLTTLASWQPGQMVNLEHSLKAGDELGGHLVSGHVDGVARIIGDNEEGEARRFHLQAPADLARFIAAKGSVCLDGTSLTVNKVDGAVFDVLLIRHSLAVTSWGQRKTGDAVNIEIDPLARYIARMMDYRHK